MSKVLIVPLLAALPIATTLPTYLSLVKNVIKYVATMLLWSIEYPAQLKGFGKLSFHTHHSCVTLSRSLATGTI